MNRSETEALIVLLCAEGPRTARDLAEILHRNVDYVRNAYLSHLVRAGQLRLNGAPTDPRVTYSAANHPPET